MHFLYWLMLEVITCRVEDPRPNTGIYSGESCHKSDVVSDNRGNSNYNIIFYGCRRVLGLHYLDKKNHKLF